VRLSESREQHNVSNYLGLFPTVTENTRVGRWSSIQCSRTKHDV